MERYEQQRVLFNVHVYTAVCMLLLFSTYLYHYEAKQ